MKAAFLCTSLCDFAAFVQKVDAQKAKAQKSLEKAEILYKALMQNYFG